MVLHQYMVFNMWFQYVLYTLHFYPLLAIYFNGIEVFCCCIHIYVKLLPHFCFVALLFILIRSATIRHIVYLDWGRKSAFGNDHWASPAVPRGQ